MHPVLDNSSEIIKWFPAIYSLVIGPGLGREEETANVLEDVLKEALKKELKLVGDGDFLWYLSESKNKDKILNLTREFKSKAILTPNKVEFKRLIESVFGKERDDFDVDADEEAKFFEKHKNSYGKLDQSETLAKGVSTLASELNNIVILRKGIVDVVSNGFQTFYVAVEGGLKRSGG